MINGYNLETNHLGYSFANSIHAGDFSGLEEIIEEPPLIQSRGTPFRTAYQEEPIEEPSILTRTDNVILEPEKECPWKLAG